MIGLREEKGVAAVQDDLGYAIGRETGGSAISYWRRGNVPPDWSEAELLAQEILKRTDLSQDWLAKFLEAAGLPRHETRAAELVQTQPFDGKRVIHTILPALFSGAMIGRRSMVDELLSTLQDRTGPSIVAVSGMGGIGKTALVSWLVHQALSDGLFEDVVWLTGATPYRSERILSVGSLTTEAVLNHIGEHLQIPGFRRLGRPQQLLRINTALSERRILIVLDNLETAKSPQDEMASELQALLGASRAILVSRHRFTGDFALIHLQGLTEIDGLDFLYRQAEFKRVDRIASADHEDLQRIAQTTGGSPLAMKLVLGQLSHLPLGTVLDHLRNVRPIRRDESDEYVGLYRHVFLPSWQLIDLPAQQLLVSMAHFSPGVGDVMEIVQEVSELDDSEYIRAIDQLWLTSFLEVGQSSSLQRLRYHLHALTQYFVLSDII